MMGKTPLVRLQQSVSGRYFSSLLGLFVGLYVITKWAIVSFGVAVAVWTVAILMCGYLALRYGDEFWRGVFGRNR